MKTNVGSFFLESDRPGSDRLRIWWNLAYLLVHMWSCNNHKVFFDCSTMCGPLLADLDWPWQNILFPDFLLGISPYFLSYISPIIFFVHSFSPYGIPVPCLRQDRHIFNPLVDLMKPKPLSPMMEAISPSSAARGAGSRNLCWLARMSRQSAPTLRLGAPRTVGYLPF